MRRFVLRTMMAASLAASSFVPASVAAEFSTPQRQELGNIIRDYLLQNPEVVRDAFQELDRRQKLSEAKKAQSAIIERAGEIFRTKGDLIAGNPAGSVTMVEFFDYNCGYCRRSMPDILKLIEADKDLRVVIKEFPILGPGSLYASRAALASREQGKYWEFHLALMSSPGSLDQNLVLKVAAETGLDVDRLKADMKSDKVQSVINRNLVTASALGIQGTPAFLIADQLIPGAVGFTSLAGTISTVRENGGCKIC